MTFGRIESGSRKEREWPGLRPACPGPSGLFRDFLSLAWVFSVLLVFAAGGDFLLAGEVDIERATLYRDGGGWIVDVAISHEDEGPRHYADWILVEAQSGGKFSRLVRRDIVSPVGEGEERPVYRVRFGPLPPDCTRLRLRGHCKVHSYGGRDLVVDLGKSGGDRYTIERKKRNPFISPSLGGEWDFFRVPSLRKKMRRFEEENLSGR